MIMTPFPQSLSQCDTTCLCVHMYRISNIGINIHKHAQHTLLYLFGILAPFVV